MNNLREYDEMDEYLFNCFEKHKDVPKETIKIIENTFKNRKKKTNNALTIIFQKVAVILIILGIISTSVVFAKDIYNFIISLFTNTTEAINTAVENNYVQELNTDYVYSNNIGIKLESLLVDDTTIDLSLIYKYDGLEDIEDIRIDNFTLKNDNDTIIWKNTKNQTDKITEGIYIFTDNRSIKLDDNTYKDSILITSTNFSNFTKIYLEISSVLFNINGEYEEQNGKWKFEIELDTEKLERNTIKYNILPNEYLVSGNVEMTETKLKIQLNLNIEINKYLIEEYEIAVLRNSFGEKGRCKSTKIDNKNIYLEYDISNLSKNIEKFELELIINEGKSTTFIIE